jgi:WS/DGAT/MGAT family acyltransferase
MRRNGSAIERLPVTDIMFLLEEQTAGPQTIALLAAFGSTDRRPSGEELASTIAPRLPAAPVLRRRVHWPPWWQGRPLWVDDGRFDVTNHVRVAAVPAPGDEGSVLGVAGELLAAPLDQTRPLWELWLLEGAADGRQWLLWKLHHAVADGEGALVLLGALVDGGPPVAHEEWRPAPPPAPLALVVDAIDRYARALAVAAVRLAHVRATVGRARDAVAQVRADLRPNAPRLPFNRPLGGRRHYLLVRRDLDAVRAAAHARGATVNDVVVAAVGAGVVELLRSLGTPTEGLALQVSVPVSLRRGGATTAGNAVVGIKIPVPLDIASDEPEALVEAVASATRARKAGPRADAGFGAMGSELMPVPLLRVVLGRALRGDQRFINSYVTDLIGPAERVSLAGAVIGEAFAIGPLSGGVGLGAAALSYGGQLAITLLADPDACPRADLVVAGMERFLSTLTP